VIDVFNMPMDLILLLVASFVDVLLMVLLVLKKNVIHCLVNAFVKIMLGEEGNNIFKGSM